MGELASECQVGIISNPSYLELVLAGLSLRGWVQKIDCENLSRAMLAICLDIESDGVDIGDGTMVVCWTGRKKRGYF